MLTAQKRQNRWLESALKHFSARIKHLRKVVFRNFALLFSYTSLLDAIYLYSRGQGLACREKTQKWLESALKHFSARIKHLR